MNPLFITAIVGFTVFFPNATTPQPTGAEELHADPLLTPTPCWMYSSPIEAPDRILIQMFCDPCPASNDVPCTYRVTRLDSPVTDVTLLLCCDVPSRCLYRRCELWSNQCPITPSYFVYEIRSFPIPRSPLFGDVDPPGGNGAVDIDDIRFIIDAFIAGRKCPVADIMPCGGGDGHVFDDDLVAVLDAFRGAPPCP